MSRLIDEIQARLTRRRRRRSRSSAAPQTGRRPTRLKQQVVFRPQAPRRALPPAVQRVWSTVAAWPARLWGQPVADNLPPTAVRRKRSAATRPVRQTARRTTLALESSRLISLALLAFCLVIFWIAGQSPTLYLSSVPVEGNRYISDRAVLEQSGLNGVHIFAVDAEAARQRVAVIPGILSAEVVVRWPNDVRVQVTEDEPVAIWQENGRSYWVNHAGNLIDMVDQSVMLPRIVATLPPPRPLDLTLTTNKPLADDLPEGQTVLTPATYLMHVPPELLDDVRLLTQHYPEITDFGFELANGLSFWDARGWTVYFGVGGDATFKHAVYEALTADLAARAVTPEYISVANPQRPYYRPAGAN